MDFEYELEEREKNNMKITIDNLTIEVPEKLNEERMNLMAMNKEEVKQSLERRMKNLKDCLLLTKTYKAETFEKRFLEYLDSEMAIYRI